MEIKIAPFVNVFNVNFPLDCENLCLGNILSETWNNKDKKLLTTLLAASKKSVTRIRLNIEPPTTDDWIDIKYEIYVTEKISYSLKVVKEKFYI